MSLINDMLRDLESRRKHEHNGKTFTEVPIAVKGKTSSEIRWWIFGSFFLLLVVIVWLGVWFSPFNSNNHPKKMVTSEDSHRVIIDSDQQAPQSEPLSQLSTESQSIESQVKSTTQAVSSEDPEVVTKEELAVTKLVGIEVSESTKNTRLSLNFNELPEYRLEQDGHGDTQSKLVISFSGVQLNDNFEIPELTGKLLERISLRPQQKQLQILVDLGVQSEVGSYELKGNNESGYILQIDINQVAPLIVSTPKKSQAQQEVPAESIEPVKPQPTKQVGEVSFNSDQTDNTAHLSRSKNRLSLDKQAYQSGLEHLRQGKFAAAESNFAMALEINPTHVQARLQLITSLRQQNKIEQAQAQMVEGLALTPESLQLRKTYARFLLSKQLNLEAIEVLQAQPFPAVAQDLEYHALLAALLQENKQFNAAAQAYARLLHLRPETALWWFGFAVSMDQTGDFEQARNAYRRALALPGLSADVQKYVQNRLQVL